jgi:TRAP-type C4-dicarboxylate transport system substrate-binding protein
MKTGRGIYEYTPERIQSSSGAGRKAGSGAQDPRRTLDTMFLTGRCAMHWIRILTAAGVLAASAVVQAQPVMKLASATINDVQHEWLRKFEAGMKARVGDRVKIEIYPASQLGAIPRMVEGVVTGTIEAFVTPYSFLVGTEPRYQVFDAIGVFEGPAHLNRVLNDPQFRPRALALGEAKGLKGIGQFYNSPVIVLSKKPIRTLADFKGQKIRVFATPLQIEPMKLLGATPVPMALGEVMPALQSGTIDGLLAGIPVLTAMKFYDAAKSVTEIHPAIVVSTLVANKRWFDACPGPPRSSTPAPGGPRHSVRVGDRRARERRLDREQRSAPQAPRPGAGEDDGAAEEPRHADPVAEPAGEAGVRRVAQGCRAGEVGAPNAWVPSRDSRRVRAPRRRNCPSG